jgi:hypothetical protein
MSLRKIAVELGVPVTTVVQRPLPRAIETGSRGPTWKANGRKALHIIPNQEPSRHE